jgi:hypothetical protein
MACDHIWFLIRPGTEVCMECRVTRSVPIEVPDPYPLPEDHDGDDDGLKVTRGSKWHPSFSLNF